MVGGQEVIVLETENKQLLNNLLYNKSNEVVTTDLLSDLPLVVNTKLVVWVH